MAPRRNAGSFRDPSGQVYLSEGRVYRTVMPCAVEDYEFVRSGNLITRLIAEGRLVSESRVDPAVLGAAAAGAHAVLEHPRIPFVSHPYEWPFEALKAAALLQLDLCVEGLAEGVMLSDASAYNIQFDGARPVFIDSLSFRRYRDGEYWSGHRQFCEQFLNPLLLRTYCGVAYNPWYRGALEGIGTDDLARVLPLRSRLSWNVLAHVFMQAALQRRPSASGDAKRYINERKMPKAALGHLLSGMRNWIARLRPAGSGKTLWSDYAEDNSYGSDEARAKHDFITRFAAASRPALLWDIGCNTGEYSEAALAAGAERVVGFDFDQGALDRAFARAQSKRLAFQPLFLDAANPAPSQGWAQGERAGLAQRADAQAVLALAVVHHLAIGRNVPLAEVIDWLVDLAPAGVIEFVPMQDPMVQRLLSLRDIAFTDYSEAAFEAALRVRAHIVDKAVVSSSQRQLYRFERK